jgi:hypothetical protein
MKTFGGPASDNAQDLQVTSDSGFVIVGRTYSYGVGGEDVWLIKTDSNGDTLWTKTYGGWSHDYGNRVQQTADSGYVIVGGSHGLLIIKTDAFGDTLWTKAYNDFIEGTGVIETIDSYVITASHDAKGGSLIKTDYSGEILWSKIILPCGGPDEIRLKSLTSANNDCYLIGGNGGGLTIPDGGYIVLTDLMGNVIWTKNIGGIGLAGPFITSAIQTSDSCYLVTGWIEQKIGNVIYPVIFLAKLSSDVTGLIDTDNVLLEEFFLYQNYPNPFNPTTNIEFSLPNTDFVTLKIYNVLGEEVATLVSERLTAGKYKYKWDVGGLASGMYFYKLEAGNFMQTKKMLLIR